MAMYPISAGQVFHSNDSYAEFAVIDGGETYFGSRPEAVLATFTPNRSVKPNGRMQFAKPRLRQR